LTEPKTQVKNTKRDKMGSHALSKNKGNKEELQKKKRKTEAK